MIVQLNVQENVHVIVQLNVQENVLGIVHEIVQEHAWRSTQRRSFALVLVTLFVAFGVP